jgi:hypothetical protein
MWLVENSVENLHFDGYSIIERMNLRNSGFDGDYSKLWVIVECRQVFRMSFQLIAVIEFGLKLPIDAEYTAADEFSSAVTWTLSLSEIGDTWRQMALADVLYEGCTQLSLTVVQI